MMKTAKGEKTTPEKMRELFEGAFRTLPLMGMVPAGETSLMVQSHGQMAGYSAWLTEDDGIALASLLLGFFANLGGEYHSLKEGVDMRRLTNAFIEVVQAERAPEEKPMEGLRRYPGGWAVVGSNRDCAVLLTLREGHGGALTPFQARELATLLRENADLAETDPLPDPEEEGGPDG